MEAKIEAIEAGKKELQITIATSDMEIKFTDAYKKFRKDIAIKGFRKGKVPIGLLKNIFGEKVQEEVIETTVKEALQEAVTENKIHAVSSPTVKDVSYKPETGLVFKAIIEVAPDFESNKYKGFDFEKEIYQIDDSDTDETIERIRNERATINSIDGEVQKGHYVIADVQRVDVSGLPVVGDKLDNKVLHIDDSEENKYSLPLIGAKAGDKRRLTIGTTVPDKGEKVDEHYEVEVKEIKERILPELNDDFAKTLGDFENFEVFKNRIKENLTHEAKSISLRKFNNLVADELVKNNPLDLPEEMINNYLNVLIEDAKKKSKEELDENTLRDKYRADAIWEIKWTMLKDKIEELESIEIADTDFEDYFKEISASENVDETKLRNQFKTDEAKSRLKEQLREKKILNIVIENSNVIEKNVPYKNLLNPKIVQQ
ncbi:MAG: trigger factor [Methanosarcinaceae archaeon]